MTTNLSPAVSHPEPNGRADPLVDRNLIISQIKKLGEAHQPTDPDLRKSVVDLLQIGRAHV